MVVKSPFEAPGRWFKANLHTHTTVSDGDCSAEERAKQYREAGYSVLAITDHGATSDVAGMSSEDFLVLSGTEFHPECPNGAGYHFVGLGVPFGFEVPEASDAQTQIRLLKEAGGEYIIAHPYWCGHTLKHILPVIDKAIGLEVFNSTCTKIGKGISSVHWDNLLAEGVVLPAVAVDDTHAGRDIFMGWTMIKAVELTVEAVMDALRSGSCYASCGPVIHDFRVTGGKASVHCAGAAEVHFMCCGSTGCSYYADDGPDITEAELEVNDNQKYVRCEVVDRKGLRAWANPVML